MIRLTYPQMGDKMCRLALAINVYAARSALTVFRIDRDKKEVNHV